MEKAILRKAAAILIVISPYVWMSLSAQAKGIELEFITSLPAWITIGCAVAIAYLLYGNGR